jgi:predicted esterase
MERSRARWFCAKAMVCLLISTSGAWSAEDASHAPTSHAPASIDLRESDDAPGVVVFPARGTGAFPMTIVLHGMCGDAARTCRHFADAVTESAHLICPRASARCAGGGASFPEQGVEEAVESAVARAMSVLGEVDESHGRTLIGYSLGAFRALRIAQSSGGKYPRVMLIGAKIAPDQQKLEQSGVERLLLGAGSWDMMHDHMQRETARVRGAAFATRFLDLGPMGHGLTANFDQHLPGALAWLRGPLAEDGAGVAARDQPR